MRNRGLLTEDDRKIITGEKEVDEARMSDVKWNIQQRIERLRTDLDILREAGDEWEELADDFESEFSSQGEIERRIQRLEELLENK